MVEMGIQGGSTAAAMSGMGVAGGGDGRQSPLESLGAHPVVARLRGNPRIIGEVAQYVNRNPRGSGGGSNPRHSPSFCHCSSPQWNYNLVLDEGVYLSQIIPAVTQEVLTGRRALAPAPAPSPAPAPAPSPAPSPVPLRVPSISGGFGVGAGAGAGVGVGVASPSAPSSPVVVPPSPPAPGTVPVPRALAARATSPSLTVPIPTTVTTTADVHGSGMTNLQYWCQLVWQRLLLSPEDSTLCWVASENQHIDSILLDHVKYLWAFVHSNVLYSQINGQTSISFESSGSCNLAWDQAEEESRFTLLSQHQLEFFKQNQKILKGATALNILQFTSWFEWFHQTVLYLSVVAAAPRAGSGGLDSSLIMPCSHSTAAKLIANKPSGTFALCCSESKPALVVVYVGGGANLRVQPPVQVTMESDSPVEIIDSSSGSRLAEYDDLAGRNWAAGALQRANIIIRFQTGLGTAGARQYPSLEALLMTTTALTHLLPCTPKAAIFRHGA